MTLAQACQSQDPFALLKRYWGYEQFRFPQAQIVESLLQGQDVLVLLPTGAGKSLCFQLPALLQPGLTMVVSPLVSLMENQVQELRDRRIQAALIHGQQPTKARNRVLKRVEQSQLQLLYLSPETLLSPAIWHFLTERSIPLSTLVIDEAHCLVQWGTTFRPVYRRLGAVRTALSRDRNPPINIAAFTATADPKTQHEIQAVLNLRQPKTFRKSPYRDNLDLTVAIAWTPRARRLKVLRFIEKQGSDSGLVYTRSRRESESLMTWLGAQGYRTQAYHAGLTASARRHIEQAWLEGKLQFVICTCAFGMGINKPDVRWIVHFRPPLTLSEYIQEIGRAGRDGQRSQVLMLVSEPTGLLDPQDRQQRQYFSSQLQEHVRQALRLAKRLPVEGNIPSVIRSYPHADMSLSLLHSMKQLRWVDPMHYKICRSKFSGPVTLDGQAIDRMAQFIRARHCRWQFILESFGFQKQLGPQGCGHCDRCLSRS